MAILYLCDRKACENCSDICKHTSDIRHAVNFEQDHADGVETGDFWEKENVFLSSSNNLRDGINDVLETAYERRLTDDL